MEYGAIQSIFQQCFQMFSCTQGPTFGSPVQSKHTYCLLCYTQVIIQLLRSIFYCKLDTQPSHTGMTHHDPSIMIESESMRIIGKNAIKSKGLCEKIKSVYCGNVLQNLKCLSLLAYLLYFKHFHDSFFQLRLIHLQNEHFIPHEQILIIFSAF